MARTSESTCDSERLKLSDPSCTMGGSGESEYLTALTTEPAITSSSAYISGCSEISIVENRDSRRCTSSISEQIEQSKCHWSQLTEFSDSDVDEVADNDEVFKALQLHRTWGCFLLTFGYDTKRFPSFGELEVGEKFAEGGQAELFHAHVQWCDSKWNEWDLKKGREWLVKVFMKGTLLRHLLSQWPQGMLEYHAERMVDKKLRTPHGLSQYTCEFLLQKEKGDLCTLIDWFMKFRTNKDCGPFLNIA